MDDAEEQLLVRGVVPGCWHGGGCCASDAVLFGDLMFFWDWIR